MKNLLNNASYLLVCIVLLILVSPLSAQELSIKSFAIDESDMSANSRPVKDLNGELCALIKVDCSLDQLAFYGNIVGRPIQNNGTYWVYVTKGTKKISISQPYVKPLYVDFINYLDDPIKSGATYKLVLEIPENIKNIVSRKSNIDKRQLILDKIINDMVYVEGGSFLMGNNKTKESISNPIFRISPDVEPQHKVTINSFKIGKYEVTQEEWEAVMNNNPSLNKGERVPVDNVSWNDVQVFITKLNSITGRVFRLPTEAEWEFAAHGGNEHKVNYVMDAAYSWYAGNSNKTQEVGLMAANELGLYDMTGNVSEWCQDWYGKYSKDHEMNPKGPNVGTEKVIRGGNIGYLDIYCIINNRFHKTPNYHDYATGFRLVESDINNNLDNDDNLDDIPIEVQSNQTNKVKMVDLGLSVKWGDRNVGASCPEDCGEPFAWGEVETKDNSLFGRREHWKVQHTTLKASQNDRTFEDSVILFDDLTITVPYTKSQYSDKMQSEFVLDSEHDAAKHRYGGKWRMPTSDEWKEMIKKCDFRLEKNTKTSDHLLNLIVVGPSGETIKIPVADRWVKGKHWMKKKEWCCEYWASDGFTRKTSDGKSFICISTFEDCPWETDKWGKRETLSHLENPTYGLYIRPIYDESE